MLSTFHGSQWEGKYLTGFTKIVTVINIAETSQCNIILTARCKYTWMSLEFTLPCSKIALLRHSGTLSFSNLMLFNTVLEVYPFSHHNSAIETSGQICKLRRIMER